MKHSMLSLLVALATIGCHRGSDNDSLEAYNCTLFNTPAIPAAEDFPMYIFCVSERGNTIAFFWHEVHDKINVIPYDELQDYALPLEWFKEDGTFIPSAFWAPTLGILHPINGIHDPCEIPQLVEYFDLPCSEDEPPSAPQPPSDGEDDDEDPDTDDITEKEAWDIIKKYLHGNRSWRRHFKLICKALKALDRQHDIPMLRFALCGICR